MQGAFSQPSPNFLNIDGKQVHPYYAQQIFQIVEAANQFQSDNTLRTLMYFLQIETALSKEVAERACAVQNKQLDKVEPTELTRERCLRIKTKNTRILVRLMNLRAKLAASMNMYRSSSSERQGELGRINQKIRDMQYSVTLKYKKLRALQVCRPEKMREEPQVKDVHLHVPLEDLKEGTEMLGKKTIQLREEMAIFKRYMQAINK